MKNIFLLITGFLFILLSLNCGNTMNEETKEEEHKESKEVVEISKAQMEVVGIKLGSFEKRNLRSSVKTNGVLELPPQNKADVSAMLGGTINSILVIEGDFVKRGETLALLEHPQYIELQQDYLETLNNFEFIKQDYERKKKLYSENISAGKELQKTEAEYKSVNSRLNSLKAKLEILNLNFNDIENGTISKTIPVKAPIQGYVRKVEANIGTYVEPQKDIFEIVDNHHIHIDLLVYENDISKIKKGQKVNFRVSNIAGKVLQAKIFAVGKAFEDDLKAVRMHAEIENPNNELIPGMYVDGRIIVDDYEVNSLPETAIINEGESSFIFIQTEEMPHEEDTHGEEGNHEGDSHEEQNSEAEEHLAFKKIYVKTGASDNGFVEVIPMDNIPENSMVVINGAYYLDSEMNKGEGEHHH